MKDETTLIENEMQAAIAAARSAFVVEESIEEGLEAAIRAAHASLLAEVEGLRRDAQRYRWLREKALIDDGNGYLAFAINIDCHDDPNYADIDAAIDALLPSEMVKNERKG